MEFITEMIYKLLPLEVSSRANAEVSKGSNLLHGIIKLWVYGNADNSAERSGAKLVWGKM